jgi:leader peptidase (prepilin peptidase)/N-methyltransferase
MNLIAALPTPLLWAYLFSVGACVGSFIGVVVERLPLGMSVVRPGSHCGSCKKPIAWYDNLPIVSYLILRGRCRNCRQAYGARSVYLEFVMGCIFVAACARLGAHWQLVGWLPVLSGLMAITYLDIDHYWVPDIITYPLGLWAFACTWVPVGPTLPGALLGLMPAALLWGVATAFLRLTGKEGLGLGDIKLLAVVGAMLGLTAGLTVVFLASLQGAIVGSLILAMGGHKERVRDLPDVTETTQQGPESDPDGQDAWTPDPAAIPFGPFLVLATLEVFFYPELFTQLFARILHAA